MKRKRKNKLDRSPVMQLYRSVARYVKSTGGTAVVLGGIQIMQWPDDRVFQYSIVVKVTGRKPRFASELPA